MNVWRQNLQEVLPGLRDSIRRAAFVAVDTEFTGIPLRVPSPAPVAQNNGSTSDVADWAGPQPVSVTTLKRYGALRSAATKYAVVQVGIACFEDTSGSIREFGTLPEPQHVKVQTYNVPVVPGFHFHSDPKSLKFLAEHHFDFSRTLIDGVSYCPLARQDSYVNNMMEFVKMTPLQAQQKGAELNAFRPIIEALFDAPVIVGHNMLIDLAYMQHQFHTPLPMSMFDWACALRSRHTIFDTKFISRLMGITDNKLGDLFKVLDFDPRELHASGFDRYLDVKPNDSHAFAHEAGFDAFMTGCVLLMLSRRAAAMGLELPAMRAWGNKVNIDGLSPPFDLLAPESAYAAAAKQLEDNMI